MTCPDDVLRDAAAVLARHIGLRSEGSMRSRLGRELEARAAACERSPDAYVRELPRHRAELQALVDAITVQESGFFRDPRHFEVLVRRALPALRGGGVVWSAGCANGQEAWSLAIALEEAGVADWHVLATDVSTAALARAEAGRYTGREVAGLSPARRAQFMRRRGDAWEVGRRLRRRVRFLPHNLAQQLPPAEAGTCRVVFCRNVLIYLEPALQRRVLAGLAARMASDGWLFLGASEAPATHLGSFAAQRVDGTYVYRPRRARERAPAPPAGAPARAARDRAPPAAPSAPDAGALLTAAEAHAAAGRLPAAAEAFRKAAYLEPDAPLAHAGLGLALEPADPAAAARAFRAARAALERAGDDALGGWSRDQLARMLDAKLEVRR